MTRKLRCFIMMPSNRQEEPKPLTRLVSDARYGWVEESFECGAGQPCEGQRQRPRQEVNFDVVYQHVIKKALQEAEQQCRDKVQIECVRSVDENVPAIIMSQVIENICKSEITITDITTPNPNVFLELGIRLAIKDSLNIIIHHEGVKIPFDLQGYRCISYTTSLDGGGAIQKIADAVASHLDTHTPMAPSTRFITPLINEHTGQLRNQQLIEKLSIGPELMTELASDLFDSTKNLSLQNRLLDFLNDVGDHLWTDPRLRKQAIDHYEAYSKLKGLTPREQVVLYEKLARLYSDEGTIESKQRAKEYIQQLKNLQQGEGQ